MKSVSSVRLVCLFSIACWISCSSSDPKGTPGTGGSGGSGLSTGGAGGMGGGGTGGATGGVGGAGGMCQYQHYFAPGCAGSVAPRCTGAGGACYSLACGCNGTVIVGCGPEFSEPYAYSIPVTSDGGATAGMACDPGAGDAGQTDAGAACPSSDVACSVDNFECSSTWSGVLANPLCESNFSGQIALEHRADCGSYHVRLVGHLDTAEYYYYDAATGSLIAIYSLRPGTVAGAVCFRGPPAGVAAACFPTTIPSSSWTHVCGADGGVVTVLPGG